MYLLDLLRCGKEKFRLMASYFPKKESNQSSSGARYGVNLGRASIYTPLTPEPPFTGDNPKTCHSKPSLLAFGLPLSPASLPLAVLSLAESALIGVLRNWCGTAVELRCVQPPPPLHRGAIGTANAGTEDFKWSAAAEQEG